MEINNVIMQIGPLDPENYIKKKPHWKILQYSNNFQELIAGASLVITHFGATVLESLAYNKPTLIVPNPEWTRTVGKEDAELLAKKINSICISDINKSSFENAIQEIKTRKIPKFPDGAEKLAQMILEI
jgi:UDP-N-acetylglucosamine--N-acetylmuramyl-(pentapeptide) pyrophosphoryl-undecaprenol N-acetylglucosamine transferase